MPKSLYLTVALMLSIAIGLYAFQNFPFKSGVTVDSSFKNDGAEEAAVNPLLAASQAQFARWLPSYCGPDLYLDRKAKPHSVNVCINGTIERVQASTGIKISRNDVIDPRVKAHWKAVMGAK